MLEDNMGLSSPWVTYFRKIEALFGEDPEITIQYTTSPAELKMYVTNPTKAEAISQLLPNEVIFGGMKATILIIPANVGTRKVDLFRQAFEGNPAFKYIQSVEEAYTNPIHYCVFAKEVVQFWDDNLGDIHGNTSTLYQDIADDLFDNTEGVVFCTDDNDII